VGLANVLPAAQRFRSFSQVLGTTFLYLIGVVPPVVLRLAHPGGAVNRKCRGSPLVPAPPLHAVLVVRSWWRRFASAGFYCRERPDQLARLACSGTTSPPSVLPSQPWLPLCSSLITLVTLLKGWVYLNTVPFLAGLQGSRLAL